MRRPVEKWRGPYEVTNISLILENTNMQTDNHGHQYYHQETYARKKYGRDACKAFYFCKRSFKFCQTFFHVVHCLDRLEELIVCLDNSKKFRQIYAIERYHDDIIEGILSGKNFENAWISFDLHIQDLIFMNVLYLLRHSNSSSDRIHKPTYFFIFKCVGIIEKNRIIKFFHDKLPLYFCLLYKEKSNKEGQEKPRQNHNNSDRCKSCTRDMLPRSCENTGEHSPTLP